MTRIVLIRRFILATLIGFGATHAGAQPANDMFANRIVITGTNIVVTTSSVGATKEPGEPYHAGSVGGASVWWSWQAPADGTVTISTVGSSFDTVLGVYTGSAVSTLTTIASDDDGGGNYTSKVTFDVGSNQVYQIAVDGYYGAAGNVKLSVTFSPPPLAPAWQLPDPYGTMIYSTNFLGKVVIVDFWATWCGPCKAEMPDLVALQAKYGTDGLVIVGADVSWNGGEDAQTVINFLGTFTPTLNYQVVMSTAANDNAFGGINAIPTTFIIDRKNVIRKKYVGTQSYNTLEHDLIPLLYRDSQVACSQNETGMTLCWPTNARPFTLQSAATPTGTWSDWPIAPNVFNGTNAVQIPATNSSRYFRLHMTY